MRKAVRFIIMSGLDDYTAAILHTVDHCVTLIRMLHSSSPLDLDSIGVVVSGPVRRYHDSPVKTLESPEWDSITSFCELHSIPIHSESSVNESFFDRIDYVVGEKTWILVLICTGFEERMQHKTFGALLDFLERAFSATERDYVTLSKDRHIGVMPSFILGLSHCCREGFTCRPVKRPSLFFRAHLRLGWDEPPDGNAFLHGVRSAAQNIGRDRIIDSRLGLLEIIKKDPMEYSLEDFLWMLNLESFHRIGDILPIR